MVDEKKRVLIVDDEESIRESLRLLLQSAFDIELAENGEDALAAISNSRPDLVLLDVMMPKLDGIDTLRELREREAELPVIMLTAANTVKTAVNAMKWGAVDYINKPFDVEELIELIQGTLACSSIAPEAKELKAELATSAPDADFGSMVGRSNGMQEVFDCISQVAIRDTTVLVTGESGTGKELIAKRIHEMSTRADQPFVAINCSAIPESLIESELFGHEKGAFTSAIDRRIGHFELADGGTLFLDEIGELSLPVQVKMLRFLQEQEFSRVGMSKSIKVDVRVIAATNKSLEDLIEKNKFRQDLYYRINVINLSVPALRERTDDIRHLVQYFVEKFSPVYGGRKLTFTSEALGILANYSWPGNVRELENSIECLMALCLTDEVGEKDLPAKFRNISEIKTMKAGVFDGDLSFEEAGKKFESEFILEALKKSNFVQTRAAELLGISRRILKYKMDKLGISDKDGSSDSGSLSSD